MPSAAIISRLIFAISICLTLFSQAAHAQLEQLATRVPSTANSLVIINAKAAYTSPLAKEKKWGESNLQASRDGMIALPSGVDSFLMAAEMDFEFMQPHWEIAVAHVRQLPKMTDIATRSGGRLDRLASAQAVERPNDSYVVALGPRIIGAMTPANRQQTIRWVRESRKRKIPELSPYLTEAVQAAEGESNHIVLALDLQDILAPAEVESELAKSKDLLSKQDDAKSLSQTIASIRGVRLDIELNSPSSAQLSIDFEQDATSLSNLAKPMLLDTLAKYGATIDDIKSWQVESADKSINISGNLSESGLRRVLTVLSSPVGPMAASAQSSDSSNDEIADASQRYFQSVTNYLNDLFLSDRQPQSAHQVKTWVERYARKIQDLDTHKVDKELISFGDEVVGLLHEVVNVVNRSQRRTDLRDATIYEPGRRRYGRYGAYGYYEKPYVTRERSFIKADEANRGMQEVQVIVNELHDLSTRTQETMSARYDRQF